MRPLPRILAWAGSLIAMSGLIGLILSMLYIAGDHAIGVGDLDPCTCVSTYICFTMLGVGFAGTAWLTRQPRSSEARGHRLHRA